MLRLTLLARAVAGEISYLKDLQCCSVLEAKNSCSHEIGMARRDELGVNMLLL